jgi:hypothetical protein
VTTRGFRATRRLSPDPVFHDRPDKIVLKDWEAGWFGINLGDGKEDRQVSRAYRGDQRALIIGRSGPGDAAVRRLTTTTSGPQRLG